MEGDDLNFGGNKARSAKTGRRAARGASAQQSPPHADTEDLGTGRDDDALGSEPLATEMTFHLQDDTEKKSLGASGPPKPSTRVSGWGEEPTVPRSRAGRRNLGEGFEQYEDERLRPRTPDKGDDSDDNDIPVIPDLEDQQEDEMATKIAVAPTVAVNRVATYRELDNDLLRQAAFLTLDNDIDLKILTKGLSGEADLIEEDKVWDWDRLFTEVTSELTSAWETDDQPEKETVDR